MNKKIASELAIGIILLLAIVIGGIFWLQGRKDQQNVQQAAVQSQQAAQQSAQTIATQEPVQTVAQTMPSGQIPKSYADENVDWYQAPKEISDIKLFKGDNNPAYKIWETGTIKNGTFAGGKILLVIIESQGPEGPGIYRFVQNNNDQQLYFMKNYSSGDFFQDSGVSDSDWGNVNKKLFSYNGQAAYDLTVASLQYPGTLFTPSGQQLKKEDDYPFGYSYDDKGNLTNDYLSQGLFFNTDLLKFAFTDPVYGDVYITDISKITDKNNQNIYAENGFYIKAPDGTFKTYSAVIDLGGDVPKITWSDGTQNNSKYSYKTESGCGAANYASDVSGTISDDNLIQMGTLEKGDVIYGYKDSNDKALKDFYAEYNQILKDKVMIPVYYPNEKPKNMTYDQFLQTHPMFFWKDSFGRIIQFTNLHYIFGGGCGKPVIYLYPEQTENISVKVTPTAGMTVSDPKYDNGWNVIADSQSNILNLADNKTYPYLFWEGRGDSIYHIPQQGFVVAKENLNSFFDDKLAKEGLIQKEINDFKEFWIPKMLEENKPYYFVTFVDRATIDKLAPLDINPKPDTTIRVLMDYKGLDSPIAVQGFDIKTPERTGFTAVEWGGVLK